jgi:hypothetical protein
MSGLGPNRVEKSDHNNFVYVVAMPPMAQLATVSETFQNCSCVPDPVADSDKCFKLQPAIPIRRAPNVPCQMIDEQANFCGHAPVSWVDGMDEA